MTAPDKPTIDEQIVNLESTWHLIPLTEDAKQAILSTLRAHKKRMEAERPRAATYELLNGYTYVTKTAYDALLAYADRMESAYKLAHQQAMENGVERDELKRKYAARWVAFSAMHERAETAERQLAELQAKHDALVKWLDNNTTFTDSGNPVLASVSKRIWYHATDDTESYPFSAMSAVALDKEGE